MKNKLLLLFFLCIILTFPKQGFAQIDSPNVIIILVDDMGYADVGVYGAPKIKTPNLERMAEQGVKFSEFYVESLCSPTRAALLTGSYAYRAGVREVFWPDSEVGMNPDEITIAELLKDNGYTTGIVGKWHLGHQEDFLPTNQGFDYYFGMPFSNDMGPDVRPGRGPYDEIPIMRNEEIIERGPDQRELTKRYTNEAIEFIRENNNEPFFLYLAHNMPHVPLFASEDFEGVSDFGLYGDVVEELDWSTGQILDELDELDIAEETLVIWLSDNGPWLQKGAEGGLATPLRNGKGASWEGGHRVPTLMQWPGNVPANKTVNGIATVMDLFPTIANLVGAELPDDRVIDGENIWPLITGESDKSPHEVYFYYRLRQLQAVRMGDWKLHLEGTRRDYNNVLYDYTNAFNFQQNEELYNLSEDIGEQRNLVLDYPEIVEKLKQAVEEHKIEIEQNSRPLGELNLD